MLGGDELLRCVRDEASTLGFSSVDAVPLSLVGDERLTKWLDDGFAGEMSYMHNHSDQRLRSDVGFQPHATALVFRADYNPPRCDAGNPRMGVIASYALGDDYHRVLKRRLFQLMDRLRELDSTLELKALVDTAPLLEKSAAVRAGLGFRGKHSNLIVQGSGSYFFLAEVLVNRDLGPSSEPAVERCGNCTKCIDVCPTRAIVAPYVVDARLCISYLTIELRGSIPVSLREGIGNRIFGCDDCQSICPWNRFASESPIAEFAHRKELVDRPLIEWMTITFDEWDLLFRVSAARRPGFNGFLRNVAVALGNSGDEKAIPVLMDALRSESPLVRSHAAWALGRFPSAMVTEGLQSARALESDETVRAEITSALQLDRN